MLHLRLALTLIIGLTLVAAPFSLASHAYVKGCDRGVLGSVSSQALAEALKKVSPAISDTAPAVYHSRAERCVPSIIALRSTRLLHNFDRAYVNVYRGAQPFLRNDPDQSEDGISLLKAVGVTDVINLREPRLGSAAPQHPVKREYDRCAATGMTFHSIPLTSFDIGLPLFGNKFGKHIEDVAYAVALVKWLKKNNRVVYVHCAEGADRTGTVIAMLRLLDGMPLDDVLREADEHSFSRFQRGMRKFIKQNASPDRIKNFSQLVNESLLLVEQSSGK